ncbi:MAG: hypothetical protein CFE31_02555 [Rhizobiales bacterium PAR1]|nr:MAG: hypothetical protein CFE31_02555 [Rhizobiales bacterium PAR1]
MKITNSWKQVASRQKPSTKQEVMTKQEAIENPASNFDTPTTIVESTALSPLEKGEALKNWAEDAERLSVAADEGMTGGERSLLPEVKAAEAVLEKQIKADEEPTTPVKPEAVKKAP